MKNERPRERLIENGAENLRLSELLAIILGTGREGESAEELARKVLNKFKTLRALDNATIEEICEIDGIGIAKATQIKAALEIGKRFIREKAEVKRSLGLPMYDAPNAVEELKHERKHPTPEKVEAIKDAFKYFKLIH